MSPARPHRIRATSTEPVTYLLTGTGSADLSF
jgi:hypothetical protein